MIAMVGTVALSRPEVACGQATASVQVGAQVLSVGPVAEGLHVVNVVVGTAIAARRQVQTRLATVMVHRRPAAATGTPPRGQPVEVHFLRN